MAQQEGWNVLRQEEAMEIRGAKQMEFEVAKAINWWDCWGNGLLGLQEKSMGGRVEVIDCWKRQSKRSLVVLLRSKVWILEMNAGIVQ